MPNAKRYSFFFAGMSLTLLMVLLMLSPALMTGTIAAQPGATLQARATDLVATAQAAQGNIGANIQATAAALATNFAATAQASGNNLRVTVEGRMTEIAATAYARVTQVADTYADRATQAVATAQAYATQAAEGFGDYATEIAATVQAGSTAAVATLEYVATTVWQDVETIQATATAIIGSAEELLDLVPPEIQALVTYLVGESSATYDPATNSLRVTAVVYEEQANDLVDILMMAGGYNPDTAMLDAITDYILVILTDTSAQLPGEVVMTYELVVNGGNLFAVLVSVTANGVPVPLEMIPSDLRSLIDNGVAGSSLQTVIYAAYPGLTYTVESVQVTESGAVIEYLIPLIQ